MSDNNTNTKDNEINISKIVGNGYRDFWESKHRYRVLKGGKGSKKSCTTSLWYIRHMMMPQYKEANLLVVRQTFNTHLTSTFAQLRWAINEIKVNHLWKATTNPLQLQYKPTGMKILFRGFDDWMKLAGTTVDKGYLCWVWIEEAFEIASEEEFENLDLSMPRSKLPKPLFPQTTLTFNPWSEKHWLKKRFFDKSDPRVFTKTTNYMCNLDNLDEDTILTFEKMKIENYRKYTVAGLGEWGISEGLIYEKWETKTFDIKIILSNENPDRWKYRAVFGVDFGYTNDPTSLIAMAVNPVDRIIYVFDEHYEQGMQNNDIAAMIIKKGYQKERIVADSSEPKSIDDLRLNHRISRVHGARKGRDSILNGIDKLQEYHLYIHPKCINTVMELNSYIWDKKCKTNENINKPIDSNNHLMDAMRYAMEDVLNFRPVEGRDNESRYKKLSTLSTYNGNSGGITAEDFKGGWG